MSQRQPPPFRAEVIGSLLRPRALLEARAMAGDGQLPPGALKAAEDKAIEEAIALQERVGLPVVTDGEFRRRSYHSYFFQKLGDVSPDAVIADVGEAHTGRGAQPVAVIKSRLRWSEPIHADDFRFVQARTDRTVKVTIPGPCALHFRGGDAAILAHAYTDTDTFWEDTIAAYAAELSSLAAAGCTYVQIDETAFAKFGDPDVQAALAARGDDWSALIDRYIAVTNRVLAQCPPTLKVGMHLCRGNRGGHWHSQGSYDAVADRLFNALDIGFYFLEYDSPRAGSLAPLRLLPPSKSVVLGLVSTKSDTLEAKDDLKARIADAARHVDLDRLGISTQCGFASIDSGNPISPAVQEAKLRLVVETARDVWGSAT